MGMTIVPPVPAFYNHPNTLDDMDNHIVARMLDQFGISTRFAQRREGKKQSRSHRLAVAEDNA